MREVLAGQPEPPRYFAEMKRLNREGPPPLGGFREPPVVGTARFASLADNHALIIDTRRAELFAAGHVPGTINVPLNKSFSTYAGSIIPFDRDFYPDRGRRRARRRGARGARPRDDRPRPRGGRDPERRARRRGPPPASALATLPQLDRRRTPPSRSARGEIALLDVRNRSEWNAGHRRRRRRTSRSANCRERFAEAPQGKPLAVICQSGARSAVGAQPAARAGRPRGDQRDRRLRRVGAERAAGGDAAA